MLGILRGDGPVDTRTAQSELFSDLIVAHALADGPEHLAPERRGERAGATGNGLGQQGFEAPLRRAFFPALRRSQRDAGGSGDLDHFGVSGQMELHPDETFGDLVIRVASVERLAVDLDGALAVVVVETAGVIDGARLVGHPLGIEKFWEFRHRRAQSIKTKPPLFLVFL